MFHVRSSWNGALLTRASPSLDHLVGAGEEREWDRQAERPRGLQIDHQLEPGRLLYRQVTRLCTLRDPLNILGDPLEQHVDVGTIREQPAGLCLSPQPDYRTHPLSKGCLRQPCAVQE